MRKSWLIIRCYLFIVFALIACLLLCGCKTQYVPVETVRTEYKTKTDTFIQKDSVHVKDSVFIHAKGDTIWYEKWHTKYVDRWRDRIVTDSFVKVDSIQVPYPVERKHSRWEQIKMDYGAVSIGASVVGLIFFIIVLLRWLRRRDN